MSAFMTYAFSDSVMDARKMEFIPDQCFDLIIDKGNNSIALLSGCFILLFLLQ